MQGLPYRAIRIAHCVNDSRRPVTGSRLVPPALPSSDSPHIDTRVEAA